MKLSHLRNASLFLTLSISVTSASELNPHTDPNNKEGWVLNKAVSDEFNGEKIDTEKWHIQGADGKFQNNFVGRAPSQFAPHNVSVSDGFFRIRTRWEPDYNFSSKGQNGVKYENITTGAIISKAQFLHGYMEIRCKAADGPISSSYWTTGKNGELDVFEHWGRNPKKPTSDKRYHTSFHDWRDPKSPTWSKRIWTNDHQLDFRVADDFHTYALEWDPDYLKIYVDGKMIRYVTREEIGEDWVVTDIQKVWVDCEVFPWEVNPASLKRSDYPGDGIDFVVDYVRIWQRGKNSTKSPAPKMNNLILNADFESFFNLWHMQGAAVLTKDSHFPGRKAVCLDGKGTIENTITVKPNTTYVVSAWARLPGTNMKNIWHNAWMGVKGYGGPEVRAQYFNPKYYRNSIQFTTGSNTKLITVFFTNDNSGNKAFVDMFELYEVPTLGKVAVE